MNASQFTEMQKERRFFGVLSSLLFLPVFSVLNVLTIYTSGYYFIFSSYFSTLLLSVGYVLSAEFGKSEYALLFSFLAILAVLPYVACYLVARLVKKPLAPLIATAVGLALALADTTLLVVDCVAYLAVDPDFMISNLAELVIHAIIVGILIYATVLSALRFRDARRPKTEATEASAPAAESAASSTATTALRTLTVSRPKAFAGMGIELLVFAGGEIVCSLKNGETQTVQIPAGTVDVSISVMNAGARAEVPSITLEEGDAPRTLTIGVKTGFLFPKISITEEK